MMIRLSIFCDYRELLGTACEGDSGAEEIERPSKDERNGLEASLFLDSQVYTIKGRILGH